MNNKLRRPRNGRMLAGVCAGISDFFGLEVLYIRILFVIFCAVPVYILMWLIVPEESNRYFND